MNNEGIKTFTAGEALEAKRRVKISATETSPPTVVYAGAGEDFVGVTEYAVASGALVACKLNTYPGTFEIECIVDSAIAVGTVLYGAASGRVSDASSGTAQGISLTVAAADYQHIECAMWNVKATTAATVSVADSGGFTAQTTVEAALAEIYQDLLSTQRFIPIPLTALREAATMAVGNAAANGGVLASDTTPILQPINGATDGCQRINWATTVVDALIFQVPLPPDLDDTKDLVLHARIAQSGTTDTVAITLTSYFNEGDTAVSDSFETNATTDYLEKTATIAAADVPSGAQTLTCQIVPGTHANSALYMTALWLEYQRKILTS